MVIAQNENWIGVCRPADDEEETTGLDLVDEGTEEEEGCEEDEEDTAGDDTVDENRTDKELSRVRKSMVVLVVKIREVKPVGVTRLTVAGLVSIRPGGRLSVPVVKRTLIVGVARARLTELMV